MDPLQFGFWMWVGFATAYTFIGLAKLLVLGANEVRERRSEGRSVLSIGKEEIPIYCQDCGKKLESAFREIGFDTQTGDVKLETWLQCPDYEQARTIWYQKRLQSPLVAGAGNPWQTDFIAGTAVHYCNGVTP